MDIARIRAQFPALDHGVAHFDGPGGSQTPRRVADAVAATLTAGLANRGTVTEASDGPRRSRSAPGPRWPTCSAPTPAGSCSGAR
ncbi:hypothetical protein [Nocardioides ungokensis]|uniref:hypothetical protein n=1 Tax=Nocardioides ungokensis TaxID=1643322 RepID=UPI001FE51298|nr:hypothetical protein [Nocardioides ungokensis]